MERQPILAVSLSVLLLLAGCSVNIDPGGGSAVSTADSAETTAATPTETATPSSSPTAESETTAQDETSASPTESTATATPTERLADTADEDSTATDEPTETADEPTETETETETDATATPTETTTETETSSEPSTESPTETATVEPTSTPTAEPPDSSNGTFPSEPSPETSPYPDRPETLDGEAVLTYAIAYEKAYLQNAVANETTADAVGGLIINDIAIRQATIIDESADGFTVQLKYRLNYTVVNEDGERRTEDTPFTVRYFINESATERTAAVEDEQPTDPASSGGSSEELPEKPDTLTDENVLDYVAAYEEAHLRNAVLTEEGAGISEINEFSVQDATVLNETEDGYGIQLEYVLDYTATSENGESQNGRVLVTTTYLVNETVTKRADPSTTDIQSQDAAGATAESDSSALTQQLFDIAFKYACMSVLGPELGPFAPLGCSILDRWLFNS